MRFTKLNLLAALSAVGTVRAQLPAPVTDLTTIAGPDGMSLRYKEPGICENTPGVRSYSGFIDVAEHKHLFFWFFESRNDPSSDPVTMWLNGGPGSDSLTGLFDELGPCWLKKNLSTEDNPNSWNEVSNMLFLSQPVGVGFSYGSKEEASIDLPTETPDAKNTIEGRFVAADYTAINSSTVAAIDAWKAVQMFYIGLPEMDPTVQSKTFHLATESYGGHWGPVFFNHFCKQNKNLTTTNDTSQGVRLDLGTLTIINGLIDYRIQAPHYPRFARSNTHGIYVNDTVASYMDFSLTMTGGCLETIDQCALIGSTDTTNALTFDDNLCNTASAVCRNTVELVNVRYSPFQNPYDIRDPSVHPQPPAAFPAYLNTGPVQQALGVDTNYTGTSNVEVLTQFWFTGDFVRPYILTELTDLLDSGTRVALIYGDADIVCNWFGGEALSLTANFSYADDFRAAGYTPLVVEGTQYGDTREFGNFSFTRVFDAGHLVPFYHPEAALAMFNRTIHGLDIATGEIRVDNGYETVGEMRSTYNQTSVGGVGNGTVKSARFMY